MSAEEEVYDLSPDKRTLRSLRSDVTPITAVEELVDNVLDNWRRIDSPQDDITIDIDFDFESDIFRIEDNSGGLVEENVKKIFSLGGSTKEKVPNSIGAYGMGAKKAILRLGHRAEIKSRALDADTAYGFVIDQQWLQSDNWEVTKRQFNDIDPGSTVIRIEDLDIELQKDQNIGDEMGEGEESSNFDTPQEYLESLREDLSETYDEFLKGRAGPENGTVSITVNGKRVTQQPPIDWAYTPFDGYHPRFYKQYIIEPEEIPGRDDPIKVDIIAGLMRTGEGAKAGTDIIIQNRRILTSNKDEMGGWGTHLPSYRANVRRTRFRVKITAESNPETLPWDTQKDRIEPNSVITDRVFNVLRRAASEYAKITYDKFPTPYTSPYNTTSDTNNNRQAWEGIEEFDYSSRQQFIANHKPNSDLPDKEQIETLVTYHEEELSIFAPYIIADPYARAYRAAFDVPPHSEEGTLNDDRVWVVPDEAQKFPEQELHMCLEAVKDTAKRHIDEGVAFNFDSADPWWQGYYEYILQTNDLTINELDPTEDIEGFQRRIRDRGEKQDLPDPILTDVKLRSSGPTHVFSDDSDWLEEPAEGQTDTVGGNEDIEEDTDNEMDEDESERENERLVETNSAGTSNTIDTGADNDSEASSEETDQGENDEDEGPDFGTTTSRQNIQRTYAENRSIILSLSESAYVRICEKVGLDYEEAQARDVGKAVLDQNIDIRQYVESANDEV